MSKYREVKIYLHPEDVDLIELYEAFPTGTRSKALRYIINEWRIVMYSYGKFEAQEMAESVMRGLIVEKEVGND
jgi:hypothetical protein